MTIYPKNNYVLCEKIVNEHNNIIDNNIMYDDEKMPEYKVISVSKYINNSFNVFPGDIIICNSTGIKIKNNNTVQYLFNVENIAGKIN